MIITIIIIIQRNYDNNTTTTTTNNNNKGCAPARWGRSGGPRCGRRGRAGWRRWCWSLGRVPSIFCKFLLILVKLLFLLIGNSSCCYYSLFCRPRRCRRTVASTLCRSVGSLALFSDWSLGATRRGLWMYPPPACTCGAAQTVVTANFVRVLCCSSEPCRGSSSWAPH